MLAGPFRQHEQPLLNAQSQRLIIVWLELNKDFLIQRESPRIALGQISQIAEIAPRLPMPRCIERTILSNTDAPGGAVSIPCGSRALSIACRFRKLYSSVSMV